MYVGGAFVRSESGRYFQARGAAVEGSADPEVVNVPRGSRKDARDAVLAAKDAARRVGGAHGVQPRADPLPPGRGDGVAPRRARARRSSAAGWPRRRRRARSRRRSIAPSTTRASATSSRRSSPPRNPVAGPHFGFSVPEPMGVVAVVAPERPALLGLVSTVLPVIAGGEHVRRRRRRATTRGPRSSGASAWRRAICPGASSTCSPGRRARWRRTWPSTARSSAMDVWSADADLRAARRARGQRQREARADARRGRGASGCRRDAGQGLGFIERFLETKTVWHPVGV